MFPSLLITHGTSRRQGLADYRSTGGYAALESCLSGADRGQILRAVAESGLRGRGGACFPTATKWRIAAEHAGPEKFVIANGGEHEPGSDKDQVLMEYYPHKVIEGLLLCALATGARKGWLYLIADMAGPLTSLERSIDELAAAGILGENILGSGFSFDLQIHRAPTTYVAGEETAAIDSIEGGPGKPRKKPPFPGEAGVEGKPTTVNNVETLAHVPFIVREGADAFTAIGTEYSKGTMLFTLGEQVQRPGVYELPFGSTYRQLIEGCGGGTRSGKKVRAVLPALSCAFLSAEHLDTPICVRGLRELGTSPGCGGVRLVESGDDVVALTLEIALFFMAEQCGQCPPCRMQTNQFVHILQAVQAGKGPGYDDKIRKLARFNHKKGDCSLIDMAAAPLLSALDLFADDFASTAGPGRS